MSHQGTPAPIDPSQRLEPGFVLLGVVAEVNDLDVTVSLPSNMVGRVPITEVSEPVSAAVERAAEADDAEDALDEDAASGRSHGAEVPDLARLFTIGQVVRCAVVSKSTASEGRTQLQLSVRPDRTNASDLGHLLCPGYVRASPSNCTALERAPLNVGHVCLRERRVVRAGCVGVRNVGRGPRLCDVAGHEGRHGLPAAVGHERRCVGGQCSTCVGALQI